MATMTIEKANETTIAGELVKAAEQGFLSGTVQMALVGSPEEVSATRLEITCELTDGQE